MAVSSQEIGNRHSFKKVEGKSKDFHKYKNRLQNNYLESSLGFGRE